MVFIHAVHPDIARSPPLADDEAISRLRESRREANGEPFSADSRDCHAPIASGLAMTRRFCKLLNDLCSFL